VLRRCALTSIGINSATMGLAVAGLLPPVVAAGIHNGSTVGILGYAALRRGRDRPALPARAETIPRLDRDAAAPST
jgi:Cu2+-exporting ATPase